MFKVIRALLVGTDTHIHTHTYSEALWVVKKADTPSWLVHMDQKSPALPTAMSHGPLGLLSDHEFWKLKSEHSPREEMISQVSTSIV